MSESSSSAPQGAPAQPDAAQPGTHRPDDARPDAAASAPAPASPAVPSARPFAPGRFALDAVRGAMIGTVETVPGVSGGTVALVVGLYETLIGSAGNLISGVKDSVLGLFFGAEKKQQRRLAARENLSRVDWWTLAGVAVGMVAALVVMAKLMEHWIEQYPIQTSALFFGMVLACVYVPFARVSRWRGRDALYLIAAAVITWLIVAQPQSAGGFEPNPVQIILAAAVAVSALVLPGLSGSFLLLTFGMYETTLGAVNDRDLAYLGLFILGAALGLATVVKGLQWLLEHRHDVTLVVLTGVMIGALRGLWPWTSDTNQLQPVGESAGAALTAGLIGFAVVVAMIVIERALARRRAPQAGA